MNIDEKEEKHLVYRTADHNPRECDLCHRKAEQIRQFLDILNIPYIHSTDLNGSLSTDVKVNAYHLYDILMDEEKLKILVRTLKLKALW